MPHELKNNLHQTIFRSAGERPYTSISNTFLQDPDIPYDVKGLVSEMLSRPSDWQVSIGGILAVNNTVGEKQLRRMLHDANEHGVIKPFQGRNERGTYGPQEYYVSDDPREVEKAVLARTAFELDRLIAIQTRRLPKTGKRSPVAGLRQAVERQAAQRLAANAGQQNKEDTKERSEQRALASADAATESCKPAKSRTGLAKTRLPDGWTLPPDWRSYARDKGLSDAQIDLVAEDFVSYWRSGNAKDGGLKADWPATWQGWVRRLVNEGRVPKAVALRSGTNSQHPDLSHLPEHVRRLREAEMAEEG